MSICSTSDKLEFASQLNIYKIVEGLIILSCLIMVRWIKKKVKNCQRVNLATESSKEEIIEAQKGRSLFFLFFIPTESAYKNEIERF